jgi:hypothetical protein
VAAHRQDVERFVIVVHRDTDLLHIALALRTSGGCSRLLNRRQQQCHQNGNNRNDDQQFDQRESSSRRAFHREPQK